MRVVTCIVGSHNLWLVALAAAVCIAGGWVAFELFRRGRQRAGVQRSGWLFLASIAAGSSVWCTHFIAMLAYQSPAPVTYDPFLSMLSLMLSIAGCGLGFSLALNDGKLPTLAGGALLGLAVSVMHYTGMMAYHVDGFIDWDHAYVVASVVIALAFGAAATTLSQQDKRVWALSAFVLCVVGLHFTGMTAVTVTPLITGAPIAHAETFNSLAVAVASVALLIAGTGAASYLIDTDASAKTLDTLRHMALNDSLTGLPNRVSFGNYLGNELERAEMDGRKIAVIGLDLDKFKEINDVRGHDAGDQALKIIGFRLGELLRDGEFAARIGGDEFAAVKRFNDQRDLMDFVQRLENALFEKMRIGDFDLISGASIGVSTYPQDADTAERLISNADLAMYRAKNDVTRSTCFYEADMDELARARRDMALDLKQAIDRQQLELHYQIQTDVTGRQVMGYEVLLRWKHPDLGYVSPAEFIPLAEETGSILEIGEWVLWESCRQAAAWAVSAKIAVNLSAVQLAHSDLAKLVQRVLLETGLPASRLELEITESSIIHDKVRSLHVLRQIRALGVTIAIDDFGTGYSSLETLRSFPFDRIKLDRSFMNEVEHSPQARAIIRAVVALGKSLDIHVLAEGVETRAQLELLETEGCDEAQGYYLGRPGPKLPPAPVIEPMTIAA